MNRTVTVGLGMLVAGAALGAAAVQTLYAQAKPPAFQIVEVTVNDQDGFSK
jgi:F0F1-type ATP synthase membrane subunit c/vacuolar-type H+-ATPase subunit K